MDARDEERVQAITQQIAEEAGGIDVLVNAIGMELLFLSYRMLRSFPRRIRYTNPLYHFSWCYSFHETSF
ncbi:hypothetical protein A374_06141 [Fictibacillus macauensis ZFHKF-1]|uniref:Uncharacterized protein n=1 Tax=Fictibacillus macauensis ZFHKF-1 TaxID=1196324 RepID=I8J325_9BACL|nr:hypothetical protein A374_06141 [Fictibacillus macauensis ZFHKF-1]